MNVSTGFHIHLRRTAAACLLSICLTALPAAADEALLVDLNGVDFSIFAAETSPRAEESGVVNCQPTCADKTGIVVCSVDLDDNAPMDQEEESPLLSAACSSEF